MNYAWDHQQVRHVDFWGNAYIHRRHRLFYFFREVTCPPYLEIRQENIDLFIDHMSCKSNILISFILFYGPKDAWGHKAFSAISSFCLFQSSRSIISWVISETSKQARGKAFKSFASCMTMTFRFPWFVKSFQNFHYKI